MLELDPVLLSNLQQRKEQGSTTPKKYHVDARACPGLVLERFDLAVKPGNGVGIAPERFKIRHEQESECGDGATQEEFRTNGSEETYGQLKTRGSVFSVELEIAECGLESPVPLNYVSLLPSSTVCLDSRGLYRVPSCFDP
ncbi:hypothetical protein R1flu_016871 [Riccia fluitans]|uniref:Uncharacterized protein n=1 Tax=Riccia fluitans TaxID=41844 RepID=A0ABD1YNW8_9MARC